MNTINSSINSSINVGTVDAINPVNTAPALDLNHTGSVLAQPLGSAIIHKLDGYNHDAVGAGLTVQIMKKRGDKARIPYSMAVAVPEFTRKDIAEAIAKYPNLVDEFIRTLYAAQREIIMTLAAAGTKTLQYSDITLDKVAASVKPKESAAKLSKDAIISWYSSQADVMAVAIASRLGVSESPTDADMSRISMVSAQVRDNLAKLAAPNVSYDSRVKDSLNWALDSIIAAELDDSGMVERLKAKLNPADAAGGIDLADMLGM